MDARGSSPGGPSRRIRRAGLALLPLLFAEAVLGIVSASGGPVPGLLGLHIGLGLALVGLCGWALVASVRLASRRAEAVTAVAFVGAASAATTGFFFLTHPSAAAATVDRVFALVALAGAALMILWGAPDRSEPVASTPG